MVYLFSTDTDLCHILNSFVCKDLFILVPVMCGFINFFFELYMIYNIILVSGVQPNDSVFLQITCR